jgi:hypothetical protein
MRDQEEGCRTSAAAFSVRSDAGVGGAVGRPATGEHGVTRAMEARRRLIDRHASPAPSTRRVQSRRSPPSPASQSQLRPRLNERASGATPTRSTQRLTGDLVDGPEIGRRRQQHGVVDAHGRNLTLTLSDGRGATLRVRTSRGPYLAPAGSGPVAVRRLAARRRARSRGVALGARSPEDRRDDRDRR